MGAFKAHDWRRGPRLGSRLQGLGPAGLARRIVEVVEAAHGAQRGGGPLSASADGERFPHQQSRSVQIAKAAPAVRRGKGGRFERVSRSAGG
jgi:hypothetical protein